MTELKVYKSTSKCKRPNDDLVESECARFKASDCNFGVVELTEIKRYMIITPTVQIAFVKDQKEVEQKKEEWQAKISESLFANFKQNTQNSPSVPENIDSLIYEVRNKVNDNFPGRTPTVSILDPQGGFWTSNQARTISSMLPVFCPTVRFDLEPPELYYNLGDHSQEFDSPSQDAATHAYYFAGLDFVQAIINIPIRPRKKEDVTMITDGDLLLNDLHVADFVLGQIIEGGIWKDKENPLVISFGTTNTTLFATRYEQLLNLLKNDFFVNYEQ